MQLASRLANFSLGDADLLRRAMGKKKTDVMAAQKEKFLQGAKKNKINPKKAEKLYTQMAKFASVLEENVPSNLTLAGQPSLSDDKRDSLIERAVMSQEGKIALAQAMANPIRRNLDYQGIARRALVVDPLPQGALPQRVPGRKPVVRDG